MLLMSREAQTEKRIYTRADAVQNVVDSHGLECLDRLFKGFSDQGSESSLVETFWSRLEEHYRWKPTFLFMAPTINSLQHFKNNFCKCLISKKQVTRPEVLLSMQYGTLRGKRSPVFLNDSQVESQVLLLPKSSRSVEIAFTNGRARLASMQRPTRSIQRFKNGCDQ